MTSTFSIASAGIWRKASAPFKPTKALGLPSIKMVTLSLPLKLTFPSTSTWTDGTFPRTSLAFPPLIERSLPMLNIFLSKRISTVVFSAIITTSSSDFASSESLIVPKFKSAFTVFSGYFLDWKEINSILIMYFPFGVAIEKVPSGFVIPPEIFCVVVFFKTMVAYSKGCPEVASITLPEIFISLFLFCEKIKKKVWPTLPNQ